MLVETEGKGKLKILITKFGDDKVNVLLILIENILGMLIIKILQEYNSENHCSW